MNIFTYILFFLTSTNIFFAEEKYGLFDKPLASSLIWWAGQKTPFHGDEEGKFLYNVKFYSRDAKWAIYKIELRVEGDENLMFMCPLETYPTNDKDLVETNFEMRFHKEAYVNILIKLKDNMDATKIIWLQFK